MGSTRTPFYQCIAGNTHCNISHVVVLYSPKPQSMRRMRPALAVETSTQELLPKSGNSSPTPSHTLNSFYSNNFLALQSFKYLHPDAKALMLIKCFRIFSFSFLLSVCYFIPLQLTSNLWTICYSLFQACILIYGTSHSNQYHA